MEDTMANFEVIRHLAETAQTKIVLLVMDGLGGLPLTPMTNGTLRRQMIQVLTMTKSKKYD
jgi:hypothetical protein